MSDGTVAVTATQATDGTILPPHDGQDRSGTGDTCDQPAPAPAASPAHAPAVVHPSRTTPAPDPVREPGVRPDIDRPAGAVPRFKPTSDVEHAPAHRAVRTVPLTPVSAPVPGSGESDIAAGKTPTSAGDVPRISLRASGLWSVAGQQTTRVGRYVADKPSFSPD